MEATKPAPAPKTNRELIQYLLPYYRKHANVLVLDLFCAALTTVCDMILPLILSTITDRAANDLVNLTVPFILKMAAYYVLLRMVEITARYFMQNTGHMMGARIEQDMRADMYRHLQTMSHAYFSTHKVGHLMSNLTHDLFDITEFSHHCPEEYFIGAIKLVVSFVVLIQVDVLLTVILFAMVPIYFYANSYFRKVLRKAQMNERKQIGNINAAIEDSFLGYSVVKSFSNEKVEEDKFAEDNKAFVDIKQDFYKAMAGFHSVSRIFDGLMLTIVIVVGGISLSQGRISAGQFIAFILYTQTLLVTLSRLIEFTQQFQRGMTGLERFSQVMETKPDLMQKADAKTMGQVQGHIEFHDVSFYYPDDPNRELVLDHLDLDIKPGEQIALVGPSGGGKTTLTNLIPRFYDVTEGAITIDGVDVRDVTFSSLRNQIGTVQQEVYLFSDSVLANIAYGKPGASYEEVVKAAKLAGAYDFIMEMPEGFDTYVGEHGVMLSGGQKQRISIARVFLKNPPILILDEATSSLDNESERFIQESLEVLAKDRTTITIAHRLSTIQNADEILVLEQGKIQERGKHEELLQLGGKYKQLYEGSQQEAGHITWQE